MANSCRLCQHGWFGVSPTPRLSHSLAWCFPPSPHVPWSKHGIWEWGYGHPSHTWNQHMYSIIYIYILYKYKNININIYIYRHILMRTDWWSSPCVYIIRDFTPKKTARWRFSNFASGTGSAGRGSGGGGITKESASESWEDSESFRSWVICGV
jgi:hypothetical protein